MAHSGDWVDTRSRRPGNGTNPLGSDPMSHQDPSTRFEQLLDALRTLRATSATLQAMLDNTTAVIYIKDLDGRYILINRQFERLFDVTREEVATKTAYDLF